MWYPHMISPLIYVWDKVVSPYDIPPHLYLRHTYPCDIPTHLYVRQCDIPIWYPPAFVFETTWYPHIIFPLSYILRNISPCDILTQLYLRRDLSKQKTTKISRGAFTLGTWNIRMRDMTHWPSWHDAFTRVTWLIHMWDMTHSHVWRDPFSFVTWRIHMCDMTQSHLWHDSFKCAKGLI